MAGPFDILFVEIIAAVKAFDKYFVEIFFGCPRRREEHVRAST
jgi:hypothetical protein